MAARETRLLLLGVVALFEPVNGYQVRRELLSWQVDEWAHLHPGSIYHGLGRLTAQGLLVRHDLDDAGRTVAVYEITVAGREELRRLLGAGLRTVEPQPGAGFRAAFGLIPLLPAEETRAALVERATALDDRITALSDVVVDRPADVPPHALQALGLQLETLRAERRWLTETLAAVDAGRLAVDGWMPPADDPGWQMQVDRARYRALLGR